MALSFKWSSRGRRDRGALIQVGVSLFKKYCRIRGLYYWVSHNSRDGIKHLKVIDNSNLVVCQVKGSFSLNEPNLAPYRTLAQKMEEKFSMFEIEHAQRSENRYADALGSQITFKESSTRVKVNKRREFIVEIIHERFYEKQECEEDWRVPIKEVLLKEGDLADLKTLKDYVLMKGELHRRMLGGILSRCVGHEEA